MRSNFLCTNFWNTPRGPGPGHPGKIPGTSQIPLLEAQGRQTFEGGHELFDPHAFGWKTPAPPSSLRTKEVNLGALLSCLIQGGLYGEVTWENKFLRSWKPAQVIVISRGPPTIYRHHKRLRIRKGISKGVVYELSEPKRTANCIPPPGLHWRYSSWLLWGWCADCGVRISSGTYSGRPGFALTAVLVLW